MSTMPCTNCIHQIRGQEPFVPSFGGHRLYLEGALRTPLNGDLRRSVRGLLQRGERAIVVDLARVPAIDAAGVGELVRSYNMALAANGALQVVNATRWVREVLERVGLSCVLIADHVTFEVQ